MSARGTFARWTGPGRLCAVLLAAILTAVAAPGAASATGPKTCAQLKGKRLNGVGGVRVVVTHVRIEDESRPIANVCTSAHGRVWAVGTGADEGLQETQVSLVASAGQWVALRFAGILGIASLEVGKVVNAKTGKRFTGWRIGVGPGGAGESYEALENLQLNAGGQLAYALGVGTTEKPAPAARKIIGVETGGRSKTLDSGPAAQIPSASLKLSGSMVTWLDAGVARSASL